MDGCLSRGLEAVGGEERMFFVVSRDKGDSRTDYHRIVLHNAARNGLQAVRSAQCPLGKPHTVAYGRLGLVYNVDNLEFGGFQLALGPQGGFFANAFLRERVLHYAGGLQGCGRHDHQQQTCSRRLPKEHFVEGLFDFHKMEAKAARNSGMGRLVSLSMMMVFSPA